MKRLILLVLTSLSAMAQTTTVSQTVVGPDGSPGSGTVYIRITAPCSYAGSYVGEKTVAVKFAPAGSPAATTVSVNLVPNVGTNGLISGTGACAGTSYTVSWIFAGGVAQPVETWQVPVSSTPVSIDSVKTAPVPAPPAMLLPSQIAQAGATTMQAMCWLGSYWGPGSCGGGGGGGGTWGSITGTLSAQSDLQAALNAKQGTITGAPGSWPSFAPVATSGSYNDLSNKPAAGDVLRFGICFTAGCGSETTINYQALASSGQFTECYANLAIAPTGSSVIIDVQDGTGASIFGATKLVIPTSSTSVVFQGTFASSPQNFARGNKYRALVTQNDSGNTAQGGTVQCR